MQYQRTHGCHNHGNQDWHGIALNQINRIELGNASNGDNHGRNWRKQAPQTGRVLNRQQHLDQTPTQAL